MEFENLKICIAHGGGNDSRMHHKLKKLLHFFNPDEHMVGTMYIDTAFHENAVFQPKEYFHNLRDFMEVAPRQINYGSDHLFHTVFYTLQNHTQAYRDNLYGDAWNQISTENPKEFWGIIGD